MCYALEAFERSPVDEVILVTGEKEIDYCKNDIVKKYGYQKVTRVVAGGKERYHSVYQGLKAIGQADYVLIHDGARPFVTEDIICRSIDTVKKEEILPAIDTYRKICDFAEIIPCSALRGQNTEDIIDSILKYLPYGPMFYDEDTVTDQPQRQIVAEVIREKALHALDAEIPHGIAVAIDKMKERPGKNPMVDIEATIICERDSHKGIIIGKGGAMLKKIGSNARFELERMLDSKVNLKLWVKVKKDWRDSDFMIKNFGYDKKEI